MLNDLILLYNTLITIETRGAHTKTMADCLRFTEKLISEEQAKTQNQSETKSNGDEKTDETEDE